MKRRHCAIAKDARFAKASARRETEVLASASVRSILPSTIPHQITGLIQIGRHPAKSGKEWADNLHVPAILHKHGFFLFMV